MIDWAQLTLFLYISARMGGFVLFNPILGRNNLPAIIRLGMALVFSVFVFSVMEPVAVPMPRALFELALRFLLEVGLGFLLGMVVNFFFYIPQLTGSVIDTQMGLTMNQIYDAGSQANMSVTGVLMNILMTMLFFAANGHHTLIRIFLTSHQIVLFGAASLGGVPVINAILELFVECTLMGIKLCMPILAAELVAQLGLGILMKVIPQINVFAINIDIKVIIGLGLIFLLIAPISEFMLSAESTMLNSLDAILRLTLQP